MLDGGIHQQVGVKLEQKVVGLVDRDAGVSVKGIVRYFVHGH